MSCLHRGPYIQRGRGFGSTLNSMFRGIIPAARVMGRKVYDSPLTKNVLETAKRSALEAGLNVAEDTLEGKNVKESLKGNVIAAKKKISQSLVSALKKVKLHHQFDPSAAAAAAVGKKKKSKNVTAISKKKVSRALALKKARSQRARDLFDTSFN